jgi:hypothetical protein
MESDFLRSCPSCGEWHEGEPYDIGSGPEFACHACDWCWGALGQDLKQLNIGHIIGEDGRFVFPEHPVRLHEDIDPLDIGEIWFG